MSLRLYQQSAIDAVRKDIADGLRCLGISLPTGTGKTHIMTELGKMGADNVAPFDGDGRVLFLLHRDTLIEQTSEKLRTYLTPGTSVGILKAQRNETGAKVVVASIHSLRSEKRRLALPKFKLVIVDEAHVSVSPTYRAVFRQLGVGTPEGPIVIGFSATWTRSDDVGLGDVWEKISFRRDVRWAVKEGHLVQPRAIQVGAGVDLDEVRTSRSTGDYREDDLGKAVMLEELRDSLIDGVRHFGTDGGRRRPAALFAPTVEAAEYFGDALRAANISTAAIYGETPPGVRRQRFAAHREGATQVLTTCTALAEGWDCPPVSLILLLRPTKHEGLFQQIFGRALRPWPGKSDALLLDFVGATDNVKLRSAVNLQGSVLKDTDSGLEELIEDEYDGEPIERAPKLVRQKRSSYEIDIFAGTSVQWLMGPGNIPFVPCGEGLVFIVEGLGGWNVAVTTGKWMASGRPEGRFEHADLPTQDDALMLASDIAEELGSHIAKRGTAWRAKKPSDGQLRFAQVLGIPDAENMTSGALSDHLAVHQAASVLNYFRHWSATQLARAAESVGV